MALDIHVEGIVQGVGFRPFVFRLASELELSGWVYNATDGVHILAQGADADLAELQGRLLTDKPPAAVVSNVTVRQTTDIDTAGFTIRESDVVIGERTLVSPDLATCPDCLSELFDPADRRFHYPFINCTNCGPRFTLIKQLPYDRPQTTMGAFAMCVPCEQEYHDPSDRRFHAQPNACFACGPRLGLHEPVIGDAGGERAANKVRAIDEDSVTGEEPATDEGRATRRATGREHAVEGGQARGGEHATDEVPAADDTRTAYGVSATQEEGLEPTGPKTGDGPSHRRADESEANLPVTLVDESDSLIHRCVEMLAEGKTIALKGLGGYLLVCDATNEQAVARLRERKHRPRKPFAVMVADLEAAARRFRVSDAEAALLACTAAPIVLLQAKTSQQPLLDNGRPSGSCSETRALRDDQLSTQPASGDHVGDANVPPVSCDRLAGQSGHAGPLHGACVPLAPSVTCGLSEVGVMLPATPVQHLLLRSAGRPLVMTSGNISEEPIVSDNALAQQLLGGIADAFLHNDRPIVSRYDDSVVRILHSPNPACSDGSTSSAGEATQFIRRARGYAPTPLRLPQSTPEGKAVLAVGPEQKSTFCLASSTSAFLSQHLGDLANAGAFNNYLETVELYEQLFSIKPDAMASDMHPDYLSAKWAREQAARHGLPLVEVQHHHAHIAAVIAENIVAQRSPRRSEPAPALSPEQEVIGIALDGTGYGDDGTIWGGEVLLASLSKSRRLSHLEGFRLPGGAQAIRHPLRAAYALLHQHGLTGHPAAQGVRDRLGEANASLIEQMVSKGVNSPLTSSAGRLFDAVSALVGLCDEASYEGEPAILLEAAMGGERVDASPDTDAGSSPTISTYDIFLTILEKIHAGAKTAELSRWFHEAFVQIFVEAARFARRQTGLKTVALSGGVFNNRFIATHLPLLLERQGFDVLTHRLLPPNDGCIAYGQAAVACAGLHKKTEAATLAPCV